MFSVYVIYLRNIPIMIYSEKTRCSESSKLAFVLPRNVYLFRILRYVSIYRATGINNYLYICNTLAAEATIIGNNNGTNDCVTKIFR